MSTIVDAFEEWAIDVNDPPAPKLAAAADILQTYGPTLTQQEAEDWWDAVADEYDALGLISQPTYTALRNEVNQSGTTVSVDLFNALLSGINALPETAVVQTAIKVENESNQLAEVPDNITRVENAKSGGTSVKDVQYDTALDEAIKALEALEVALS